MDAADLQARDFQILLVEAWLQAHPCPEDLPPAPVAEVPAYLDGDTETWLEALLSSEAPPRPPPTGDQAMERVARMRQRLGEPAASAILDIERCRRLKRESMQRYRARRRLLERAVHGERSEG